MKKLCLPLLLGLVFVLSGCKGSPAAPTAPPSATPPPPVATPAPSAPPTAAPTPTPIADPVWDSQESSADASDREHPEVLLITCKFTLPHIQNAAASPAYAAINDYYLDLSAGLRTDALANEGQAADDYATSKTMGYAFTPYSDEETFEIKAQSARRVSILRTHYGHTGGAYPTVLYMADHFDLATGKKLTFADRFTDPAEAEKIIRAELLRQGAAHPEYDQDALTSAFQRENFYPTDGGTVFFYQPESLAPHAAALPVFSVSNDLLEGLVSQWE
ncbi:MAG: DUF4163 domain-containing protein [Pseudoflavonifractor sp.]